MQTDHRHDKALALLREGQTFEKVAKATGLCRNRVGLIARSNGIHRKPRGLVSIKTRQPLFREVFHALEGRNMDDIEYRAGFSRTAIKSAKYGTCQGSLRLLEALAGVAGLKLALVPIKEERKHDAHASTNNNVGDGHSVGGGGVCLRHSTHMVER